MRRGILLGLLLPLFAFGQSIVMQDASMNVCSGTFYDSGGDAGTYQPNESLVLTLCPDVPGNTVEVDFTSVELASSDVIRVYEGNSTSGTFLRPIDASTSAITVVSRSADGCLTFEFTSNAFTQLAGWEAGIQCIDPATLPPVPASYPLTDGATTNSCGGNVYDSGGEFGDYGPNETIVHTFCSDVPGMNVQLDFDAYDLASSDELKIYEGTDVTGNYLRPINSSTTGNPTVVSRSVDGCLTLEFTSNAFTQRPGWEAALTCVDPATLPPVPPSYLITDGVTVNTCEGNFYDDGGAYGNYAHNQNSTYTICPDIPGNAVNIDFSIIELENNHDELLVYSGTGTANYLKTYDANSLPTPVYSKSTDGCLTFVFETDGSISYAGWEAEITCVDQATLPVDIDFTDGTITNACGGEFFDDGGQFGDYAPNQNGTHTICPDSPGDALQVYFSDVDFVGADVLNIYEGQDITGRRLNRLNASSSTAIVESGSPDGCLTFEFLTDATGQGGGWQASLACINPADVNNGVVIVDAQLDTMCGGVITDPGGSLNYPSNQDVTYTICSSNNGPVVLDFTTFQLASFGDELTIYDGPNTTAPLMGVYGGTSLQSQVIESSRNNACLTLNFSSNSFTEDVGFEAEVTCNNPCQQINTDLSYSILPDSGYIHACQGSAVDLNATNLYPENGDYYTQDDGTSNSYWVVSGDTIPGMNISYTFPTEGVYTVNYYVEDIEGCTNSDAQNQVVRVATTPDFSGTQVANSEICEGKTNTLIGQVQGVEASFDCAPPLSGVTFLPDGSGVEYTTDIEVTCFQAGQTIASASDIEAICLQLEHSYSGDLDISIECPNGQSTYLFEQSLGGAIWGEPVATNLPVDGNTSDLTPGVGYDYCFTPLVTTPPSTVTLPTYTDPIGNVSTNVEQIPAGAYGISGDWNDLIGCPMNGDWTIRVRDNLSADNGYIFMWTIAFDQNLLSNTPSFTPQIVDSAWVNDPTIISNTNGEIVVEPTTVGPVEYTYSVTDDFGCTYDTVLTFTVLPETDAACICPEPVVTVSDVQLDCFNPTFDLEDNIVVDSIGPITIHENFLDAEGDINAIGSTIDTAGVYYVRVESPTDATCITIDTIQVRDTTINFEIKAYVDPSTCNGIDGYIELGLLSPNALYHVSYVLRNSIGTYPPIIIDTLLSDASGNLIIDELSRGVYDDITVMDPNTGCSINKGSVELEDPLPFTLSHTFTDPTCGNADGLIDVTTTGATPSTVYEWSNGATTEDLSNLLGGSYKLLVTDGGCVDSLEVVLTDARIPVVSLVSGDSSYCEGEAIANLEATADYGIISWYDDQNNFLISGNTFTPGVPVGTTASYYVQAEYNGCTSNIVGPVSVSMNPLPTSPVLTGNTDYCQYETSLVTSDVTNTVWFSDILLTTEIGRGGTFGQQEDIALTRTVYAIQEDPVTGCISPYADFTYVVEPIGFIDVEDTLQVCFGEPLEINAEASNTITWSNGMTGSTIIVELTSSQTLVASIAGNCGILQKEVFIGVLPNPQVSAGPDQVVARGEYVELEATGGQNYEWFLVENATSQYYLDCRNCVDPGGYVLVTSVYAVEGTNENGCKSSDTVVVTIDGIVNIYVPNVFSPNGDGTNDVFQLYGPEFHSFDMRIFNRWGEEVFRTGDKNDVWDGTYRGQPVPLGVYVYSIRGKAVTGEDVDLTGNVTIVK